MTISHFAHSYAEGYVGGFKFLAIMNMAMVNISAQVFLQASIFISRR